MSARNHLLDGSIFGQHRVNTIKQSTAVFMRAVVTITVTTCYVS